MGAWAVFLSVRFVTLPCHYLRELALLQTLKLSSQVRCAGPHAGWVAKPGMLSRPQAVLFYICADHGRQACGLSLAPKFPDEFKHCCAHIRFKRPNPEFHQTYSGQVLTPAPAPDCFCKTS